LRVVSHNGIVTWLANRQVHLDLNQAPIANFFQHLAHEGTPKAKAILVKSDRVADALGPDVEVLDGLVGAILF
jgi:hypothetical protein